MKKKRYDRSNGSATAAANDTTMSQLGEGTAIGGGGQKDTTTSNNATTMTNDIHHNLSTPCCNLLAAIVSEIFPTLTTIGNNNAVSITIDAAAATTTTTCEKQQPLLGRMILNHLLNERKRTRAGELKEYGGRALDSSFDIVSSLMGSSLSNTNKKKSKKLSRFSRQSFIF